MTLPYKPLPKSTKADEAAYFIKRRQEAELIEEMDSWLPNKKKSRNKGGVQW